MKKLVNSGPKLSAEERQELLNQLSGVSSPDAIERRRKKDQDFWAQIKKNRAGVN